MRHLIEGVRSALAAENWYAALGLALALPDICGYLEGRQINGQREGSQARSVRWFDENSDFEYLTNEPDGGKVKLSGRDCYALRCAYLHQGDLDLTDQWVRETLRHFRFVRSSVGGVLPQALDGGLLIEPAEFCLKLCSIAERWLSRVESDPVIARNIDEMAMIEPWVAGKLYVPVWTVKHDRRWRGQG